jgi:Ca2+-binding EF-hand superfamily protein
MKILDKNNDGFVDVEEFATGLSELNIFTSIPEQHTLLRKFDQNGDGKVSMEEFYNTLAAMF